MSGSDVVGGINTQAPPTTAVPAVLLTTNSLRKSAMRSITRAGCLVLSLIGVIGCQPSTTGTNTQSNAPLRGETATLVVPKEFNLPATWEVMIQEWSAQSGATAQFSEYDSSQPLTLQSIPEPASGGVVAFVPVKELCNIEARFVEQNQTPQGGEIDTRDLLKGLKERVLSRERRVIAYPISVPVLVCYYRKDLLTAARLKPPETWEEYEELVSTLDKWAPGLVAVEPLGPSFRATTFAARSIAYCKHPENFSVWFDLDSGQPVLDSAGFQKSIEVAQKTWSKLSPESHSLGPADCRQLVLSGKAAITLSYESGVHSTGATSQQAVQRADGIEVGICALPGSKSVYNRNSKRWDTFAAKTVHAPALCGFDGIVAGIAATSAPTNSAAMNFLASVTAPTLFDQAFGSLPKNPCRESQVTQAASWYGPELSGDEASEYVDIVCQSLRDTQLVFELPVSGSDEFRQATSRALEPLLKGEASPQDALTAMQKAFEAIVEQRGSAAVRESHRRGLGMLPALKQ